MLDLQRLRAQLGPLYEPDTMPTTAVAYRWARAYFDYARDAQAGPLVPASPPVPLDVSGEFLTALDQVLRTTWMAVAWVGPGATGVTTVVPPVAPFLLANSAALLASTDRQLALSAIAQSIHTYTLSITVTVTTATGAASVVPLA